MKILVPTDGSPSAQEALEAAVRLASPEEPVIVLVVTRLSPTEPFGALPYAREYARLYPPPADVVDLLERATRFLEGHGLRVDGRIRFGNAVTTILEVAARDRVDLIVIGSHGRTGLRRFLLGSVSAGVASHAPCSVLIARGLAAAHEECPALAARHTDHHSAPLRPVGRRVHG